MEWEEGRWKTTVCSGWSDALKEDACIPPPPQVEGAETCRHLQTVACQLQAFSRCHQAPLYGQLHTGAISKTPLCLHHFPPQRSALAHPCLFMNVIWRAAAALGCIGGAACSLFNATLRLQTRFSHLLFPCLHRLGRWQLTLAP